MKLDRFINNVRTGVAKRFGLKTDAEIDAFFIGMSERAAVSLYQRNYKKINYHCLRRNDE